MWRLSAFAPAPAPRLSISLFSVLLETLAIELVSLLLMRKVQVHVHVHVQTSAILVSTDPSISRCYYRDRLALFRSAFAAEAQDACVDWIQGDGGSAVVESNFFRSGSMNRSRFFSF